ncbi:MAG: ABC transporter permease [Spirochaetia bacterium]
MWGDRFKTGDNAEPGDRSAGGPRSSPGGRQKILLHLGKTIGFALIIFILFHEGARETVLQVLFSKENEVIYDRIGLVDMLGRHLLLVIVSSSAATVVGIVIGIVVTRPLGRDFLGVVRDIASLAQTFPPVAVLALAVPALGYGFEPTVAALFLYSLLPVLNNTIDGMESIPKELTEASRGLGMTKMQVLLLSELPLSARVIIAGIRTTIVLNIGTATVGAVVGAGGLGVIIVAGLVRDNTAFVFTGAVTAALLALSADRLLAQLEGLFYAPRKRES